jgi:Family of unknown function (DUF6191)
MTNWGLDTLFNPSKRHMDEEKRRLQSTREEVGDSSGGKRIDLESGKVTISRARRELEADADELEMVDGAAPEAPAETDGAGTAKAGAGPVEPADEADADELELVDGAAPEADHTGEHV